MLFNSAEGEEANVGLLACNESKNRYHNVLPTASRVLLAPSEFACDEDYINADHVAFPNLAQRYILTQAPLECTRTAFWKMIWDQRCECVIALLPLARCDRYWPCGCVGEISVANLRLRCLERRRLDQGFWRYALELDLDAERRSVVLLHDKRWPDFGTPSNIAVAQSLVREMEPSDRPFVIHCSAGVGRSGLLCLIHAALALQGTVPLIELLPILRAQRRGAVANGAQFAYAHAVLADCLPTTQITSGTGAPAWTAATARRSAASVLADCLPCTQITSGTGAPAWTAATARRSAASLPATPE